MMWNPVAVNWLNLLNKLGKPWQWLLLSSFALLLEYITGPLVQFPIVFIFPVALAAWHRNMRWAVGIALSLSLLRGGLVFIWDFGFVPQAALFNLLIRITVLVFFAGLIHKISMQSMELRKRVKTLEGILPICSFCKRIRDKDGAWNQMESYITNRCRSKVQSRVLPRLCKKTLPGVI